MRGNSVKAISRLLVRRSRAVALGEVQHPLRTSSIEVRSLHQSALLQQEANGMLTARTKTLRHLPRPCTAAAASVAALSTSLPRSQFSTASSACQTIMHSHHHSHHPLLPPQRQRGQQQQKLFSSAAEPRAAVVVPSMGESITDGIIASVLKKPGEAVAADEIVAQVETDKVTIDVRSQEAGFISEILVSVGDTVTPGAVVASVSSDATSATATSAAATSAAEATSASSEGSEGAAESSAEVVDVIVPSMGESITDGTIAALLKTVGDAVQADEIVTQIETDKVTMDVRAAEAGVIQELLVKVGDTVTPGTKVAAVQKGAAAASKPTPSPSPSSSPAAASAAAASIPPPPSPKAAAPPPSAAAVKTQAVAAAPPPPPPAAAAPASANALQLLPKERERRVPMTRLRRRVAQRLKDSQNTFALLTTFNEVDMTNLMALRNSFKDEFLEKHGVKLGFMSAFVKAAVSALQQEPVVNAVIDGDNIIYRDYIDVSIAVGTPKGLVVPVIRGADQLSFAGIEKTITALGKKAREGTISIDDMAGGTFTISNGGVYGSLISTPIINPPQSAILGMHATQQRPMVVGKEILARPMMYVALTYDHRLIDGREAVLFLRRIKDVIEDPRRLLLDL